MANPAIQNRPRNERRFILANEERARKSGRWPKWETKTFPRGTVGPRGWVAEFTRAHTNHVFSVLDRTLPDGTRHFAVTSLSEIRPTWPEMQRIKDELAGVDATAVEVYPPQREIVDDANMYHCWVLPAALPFSLAYREEMMEAS